MKSNIFLILTVLCVILVDLFTKFQIVTHLKPLEVLPVLSFFNIVFVINKGIGFSLLSGLASANTIMLTVNSILTLALIVWMFKEQNVLSRTGLAFVVGGALGNLLDRVAYGGVVDFLDFHIGTKHWPAFNVADAAVCLGAFLLILSFVKGKPNHA